VGFTKLDEDFFDSSLVAEGPIPTAVFVLLLAKAKPDGIARVAATVVGGRLGLTDEQTREAFDVLQGPDPHSRSLEHEGRRIKRVDGGWLVLNYKKRREMGLREAVREYDRERKRAKPVPEDSGAFPESSASASPSASVVLEGGAGGEGLRIPPDVRGEKILRDSRVARERLFYARITRLAELQPDKDPTEIAREVTSYTGKDGKAVTGIVRPERLSDERLEKSLEDAQWWIEELEKKRGAADPVQSAD
jgi:hypothetical protein